jgi:hypothetical protein
MTVLPAQQRLVLSLSADGCNFSPADEPAFSLSSFSSPKDLPFSSPDDSSFSQADDRSFSLDDEC